jgi:hypothetical protein
MRRAQPHAVVAVAGHIATRKADNAGLLVRLSLAEGCQVRSHSLRSWLPDVQSRADGTHGGDSIRRKVLSEQQRGLFM